MMRSIAKSFLLSAMLFGLTIADAQETVQPKMSFFVTSVGMGDGANLGGLDGADKHCDKLAKTVGSEKDWHAYLSQTRDIRSGEPEVHARDRIGVGPWFNSKGEMIAANVADLHGDRLRDSNNIRKPTALDEHGNIVNGSGDSPNKHDMLTGSDANGYAFRSAFSINATCSNWTSNNEGSTFVGHHDRLGGPNVSWNSVHATLGCSQEVLVQTGGDGLFYCFAID